MAGVAERTSGGLATRLAVLAGLAAATGGVLWLGWDQPVLAAARWLEPTWLGRGWALGAYWLGQGGLQLAALALWLGLAVWLKRPADRAAAGFGLGAVAVSGLTVQALKHLLGRPRPRLALTDWQVMGFSLDSDLHSFPSGHAATSFALAAVLAARFPRQRWLIYGLAALVCAGRVVGTSHYLSDVLSGAALGLMIGWPLAHLAYSPRGSLVIGKEQLKGAAALLAVLAVAGALLLGGLGAMPLTDRDEGEYAAAVTAMRNSGDYVVPTLNGVHYLEKPILIYWAMAGAESLLGPGEEAARLPSALAAWLVVLAVGLVVWRTSGRAGMGAAAAAATAFTPLFGLVARACLTDMLLTLWTTASLALFFLATEKEHPASRAWFCLAWAALGLGFLTKGPVAPAVVLPTALIYALVQGRLLITLRRAQIPLGILIFLAVNAPWYGLAFWRLGEEFWRAFFVSQNLRRFSEVLLGHGGGLFYYFPVLFLGAFPFTAAALPELFASLVRDRREVRAADPMARLRLLSAIAALVVFVVFSLAATKQINYILPALPFLGVLAGARLWRLGRGQPAGRVAGPAMWWGLAVLGGIWALALLAVPAGLPLFWDRVLGSIRFDSSEYALPPQAPILLLWPLAAAAVLGLGLWWCRRRFVRGRPGSLSPILAATGAIFCGVLLLGLLPQAAAVIQTPARDLAQAVARRAPAGAAVLTYGLWKPSLIFYAGRDLPRVRVDQVDRLTQALASPGPVLVMSRQRLREPLAAAGAQAIEDHGGYLLAGNPAAARLWRGEPVAPPEAESAPAPADGKAAAPDSVPPPIPAQTAPASEAPAVRPGAAPPAEAGRSAPAEEPSPAPAAGAEAATSPPVAPVPPGLEGPPPVVAPPTTGPPRPVPPLVDVPPIVHPGPAKEAAQ